MTNPTPSYDDLLAALARERLHNPWWTTTPNAAQTDDEVTCARRRRQLDHAYQQTGDPRRVVQSR